MLSSNDARQRSAERARALLAVFDIQPPPDFAVQVLARVYALQAACALHAHPLPSQQPSRGWWKACGHVRQRPRVPGQRRVACGLVVASAVLLWCMSTRLLPTPSPEEAQRAYTAQQYDSVPLGDHLDTSDRIATALQEVVAAAEPVRQPSMLALQSREAQGDEADLAQEGEHRVLPETPMTPDIPVWTREAPKLSARAQEPQSGRHRGLHGKAKRSGKGLRLSRHVPA
jgi:hypothetical protein